MTAADDGNCPGTCNSQWRKDHALYRAKLAEYDAALAGLVPGDLVPNPPAPPESRPWAGQPVWCSRCMTLIKAELDELDDLIAGLARLPPGIRPAAANRRERVRVTTSRGKPSASPPGDDLEEFGRWLRDWEAAAKKEDWPRPRRGFLATEATTIIGWLYHHFELLILDPDAAEDFGAEVRAWHRTLSDKAHYGSMPRHVKKRCPACKRYTLFERPGDEYISCVYENCNGRFTAAELEARTA